MGKKWYVVQAYSGYESKVKLSLEERIRQAGAEESFGEILIPKENVTENRPTGRRVTSRTFYPGYIFVEMTLEKDNRIPQDVFFLIKETTGVGDFVGSPGRRSSCAGKGRSASAPSNPRSRSAASGGSRRPAAGAHRFLSRQFFECSQSGDACSRSRQPCPDRPVPKRRCETRA